MRRRLTGVGWGGVGALGVRGDTPPPAGGRSLTPALFSPLTHTPAGEDYWRSAVWVNVNYLVAGALSTFYGVAPGPHRAAAAAAGAELTAAVVAGVAAEYARSGFLWESYRDSDGTGRGTHPFTGWTALVAPMAAGRFPF